MGLLDNRIAVITGSSRGLGLAMARAFAGEGASVVVSSRSEAAVQKAIDVYSGGAAWRAGRRPGVRYERHGASRGAGRICRQDVGPL